MEPAGTGFSEPYDVNKTVNFKKRSKVFVIYSSLEYETIGASIIELRLELQQIKTLSTYSMHVPKLFPSIYARCPSLRAHHVEALGAKSVTYKLSLTGPLVAISQKTATLLVGSGTRWTIAERYSSVGEARSFRHPLIDACIGIASLDTSQCLSHSAPCIDVHHML